MATQGLMEAVSIEHVAEVFRSSGVSVQQVLKESGEVIFRGDVAESQRVVELCRRHGFPMVHLVCTQSFYPDNTFRGSVHWTL